MLRYTKKMEKTYTEERIIDLRGQASQITKDSREAVGEVYGLDFDLLRRAWLVKQEITIIAEKLQIAAIVMSGGRLAHAMTYNCPIGDEFEILVNLSRRNGSTTSHNMTADMGIGVKDLAAKDEIYTYEQHRALKEALAAIGDDARNAFTVVAHHPSMIVEMHRFLSKKASVRREFTLNVDNNFSYCHGQFYMREQGNIIPPSKVDLHEVERRTNLEADYAMMLSENLMEQACYNARPALNCILACWSECLRVNGLMERQIHYTTDRIKKSLKKYKGFSSFGRETGDDRPTLIRLAEGITAIAGVAPVSHQTADRAHMDVIQRYAAAHVCSVQTQRVRVSLQLLRPTQRRKKIDWAEGQEFFTHQTDAALMKSISVNRRANDAMKKIKTV